MAGIQRIVWLGHIVDLQDKESDRDSDADAQQDDQQPQQPFHVFALHVFSSFTVLPGQNRTLRACMTVSAPITRTPSGVLILFAFSRGMITVVKPSLAHSLIRRSH